VSRGGVGPALMIVAVMGALACVQTPDARGPAASDQSGGPRRTPGLLLLVSVEGLRAAPARDPAQMPTVAALSAAGAWAQGVRGVGTPLTYPAHATIVTGRAPDAHGVVADRLLGRRGVRGIFFWHATRVQGPSLWQSMRAADRPVAAIGWPSTVGAAAPLIVPDLVPLRPGETWLGVLEGAATPGLLEAMRQVPGSTDMWPAPRIRDAALSRAACAAVRDPLAPQLVLLRLSEPAAALQTHGPASPPVREALRRVDQRLSELLACIDVAGRRAGAAVAVVGDRVLSPVHTRIDPNTLLAQAGLIVRDATPTSGVGSWRALVRATDALATVYATDEQAALQARDLLERAAGRSGAFRVLGAARLQELRGDPRAWFGLEAAPGYVFGDAPVGPLLRPARRRAAGRGEAGSAFVLAGAGVRVRQIVPDMSLLDVAPTLAQLLGLPLEDVEGRALVGLLVAGGAAAQ